MSRANLLARAKRFATWVALGDGRWKCIIPGVTIAPGEGVGSTPLEALASALGIQ